MTPGGTVLGGLHRSGDGGSNPPQGPFYFGQIDNFVSCCRMSIFAEFPGRILFHLPPAMN